MILKRVEYSLIVRKKLKKLRKELTMKFGEDISRRSVKRITDAARTLGMFETKGKEVSAIYNIDCDYRFLYVGHNYLFYRIEQNQVVVVEMFDEREDFMWKLFGIRTTLQETYDFWDE